AFQTIGHWRNPPRWHARPTRMSVAVGRDKNAQRPSLAPLMVEVLRRKPGFERALARRPFGIEHRIPGGVAAASFHDHMVAEDSLEGEPVALRGAPRGGVERVGFPFAAPIAEFLEHVARQEILRFGPERRALERAAVDDVADLDHP